MQQPYPPLTGFGRELLAATLAAHANSCDRQNLSSVAVSSTAIGSGDYAKAIACGILSFGSMTGPLEQTANLLKQPDPGKAVDYCLQHGLKVPGWGNSFEKGKPDPAWANVERILLSNNEWHRKFGDITGTLHFHKKMIYPNPSAYTAATAIEIGLPTNLTLYLLIAGRLAPWTQMVNAAINGASATTQA